MHEAIDEAVAARSAAPRASAERRPRARRDHGWRAPARPAHAGLRRGGVRQDAARDGVPRPRDRTRRARSLRVLRGDVRRAGDELRLARLRSPRARAQQEAHRRLRQRRAPPDRGDRRVRPRGAVHPARLGHGRDRREARGARLRRDAVLRPLQRRHPARRAEAPLPVPEGARRHGRRDGRARRGHADATRARGVHLRLRHRPRQPHRGPARDAQDAHRQVPRRGARRERVPLPARREGSLGPAHHLARPRRDGVVAAGVDRGPGPRRDAGRASPPASPRRSAAPASAASISPSRSLSSSSPAT
jgi:hypothetical protein